MWSNGNSNITLVEVKIGKNTLENNLPIQQLFSEHILWAKHFSTSWRTRNENLATCSKIEGKQTLQLHNTLVINFLKAYNDKLKISNIVISWRKGKYI